MHYSIPSSMLCQPYILICYIVLNYYVVVCFCCSQVSRCWRPDARERSPPTNRRCQQCSHLNYESLYWNNVKRRVLAISCVAQYHILWVTGDLSIAFRRHSILEVAGDVLLHLLPTYLPTYIPTYITHIHTYHAHTHAHTYYLHTCVHTTYIHTYIRTNTNSFVSIHKHCASTYMYIYMHICADFYILEYAVYMSTHSSTHTADTYT